jgi:hypothetical protein
LAREHLLASGPSQAVATFDVDLLHDYRARRPPMTTGSPTRHRPCSCGSSPTTSERPTSCCAGRSRT